MTADGIARAIGHGKLGEVAQRYGVPPDQLSGLLAHVLPGLVDRMSPDGTVDPRLAQGGTASASPLDPAS